MAVGVDRRANKASTRPDLALPLYPVNNAMSFAPSPNTTGVNPSDHTSENRGNLETVPQGQGTASPTLSQQINKKRHTSKGKIPAEIRRSSSTPHMRNLALTTSGELSPTADKRRNKLGYHRTSVACGHCRRRKIRCLVAADDPNGRCANCIRLKKECNFYPVEQTPDSQRSQTNSVKDAGAGATASSATSSPQNNSSVSGDRQEEFRQQFAGPPGQAPTSRFGIPSDAEIDPHHIPHSSGMQMQHPPYAYPHSIETQWQTPGFLPSSSVAETSPSSSSYWRPSPSATNSVYGSESNVSAVHTPATMSSASNMSYAGHQEAHGWGGQVPNVQPPTRSMSYGNIEGLPHQYPNSSFGVQAQDFSRRTSPYPYPTTIDTNPAILHSTTIGGASGAPLSAPILPNQQFAYPPTWNSYGGVPQTSTEMPMTMPGRSMSAQWYNEPGQLDQVQEEGAPPMAYSQHGMQFYSGS